MPAKRQDPRARLRAARKAQGVARREMAAAAKAARAAGVPVQEIAELLGYRTRKAVYDLIARES